MHDWIVKNYINLLSSRLIGFRKVEKIFNFKCPYCGDSKRSRSKARGYIYQHKSGKYNYICHNCGMSVSFEHFLNDTDPNLYDQYKLEMYRERKQEIVEVPDEAFKTEIRKSDIRNFNLKTISSMDDSHPGKKYVLYRKIPEEYQQKLYYAPNFVNFVNSIVPGKFKFYNKEPRLIIPFRNKDGVIFGFQGRAFGPSDLKYITIMLDDSKKIFGLDTVDFSQTVYIVEGPIDSMFIDNSLAMVGADASHIENCDLVVIYDNEPRNQEIVKRISANIDAGNRVVIWPKSLPYKDINEMIMAGMTKEKVKKIINDNTFSGLIAKYILNDWKRI